MKYIVSEIIIDERMRKTAIGKARNDIETVAQKCGYEIIKIPMLDTRIAFSHLTHIWVYRNWNDKLKNIKYGDEIIIQLPLRQHTLLLPLIIGVLRKRGARVYGLLHDLDMFRISLEDNCPIGERIRRQIEEKKTLKLCNAIIAHNTSMKKALIELGFNDKKIINLEIFDYLSDDNIRDRKFDKSVIIAGNLNKNKAKYVYNLPEGVRFNLYGINYTGSQSENVKYYGSFSPDELSSQVEGSFGLTWDGESSETCTGAYGQYLKMNNPHKASFYLSSGIPVFIWKEAALSGFIIKHNCGIVIESLYDIPIILNNMTNDDYQIIRDNAAHIALKLREGYFTKIAIHQAEKC